MLLLRKKSINDWIAENMSKYIESNLNSQLNIT